MFYSDAKITSTLKIDKNFDHFCVEGFTYKAYLSFSSTWLRTKILIKSNILSTNFIRVLRLCFLSSPRGIVWHQSWHSSTHFCLIGRKRLLTNLWLNCPPSSSCPSSSSCTRVHNHSSPSTMISRLVVVNISSHCCFMLCSRVNNTMGILKIFKVYRYSQKENSSIFRRLIASSWD